MNLKNINVIELRNYLLKPNVREKFANYFAENFVDSQNILGGNVLGQFYVTDKPDNFFWVRGFENMQTRSSFLNEFYYGDVWKKCGNDANEMMIDSDNVYLLKPMSESQIFRKQPFMKIDFYFAADGKRAELVKALETKPGIETTDGSQTSIWLSELTENDFPRLPAFQNENLVVLITGYEHRSTDFRDDIEGDLVHLLSNHENIILAQI
jgi:hypothetical protein